MSFLLVTNDDGVECPALLPFLRALSKLGTVRAVVPARERSWIAKAITRFDAIATRRELRDGFEVVVADGFPADCTQLGVHSLFGERPEMVISGINVGYNHGRAFLLSSGTVGAAAEGWIAGLPALAFSAGDPSRHEVWAKEAWSERSGTMWTRLAELSTELVQRVRECGLPPDADLVSVNLPHDADLATPRRVTRLAKVGYEELFHHRGEGVFAHAFRGGFRHLEGLGGSDLEAAERGHVSITPVRLAHTADVPDAWRRALELG
jgi:5'-nucleotidase